MSELSCKMTNMENFMNPPIPYMFTEEDVRREYEVIKDKKKVAAVYGIPVKEVTRILRKEEKEDGRER